MESEKKIFEMMNKKAAMSKYWMPLVWATNIINRARREALITSDQVVQTLLVELSDIRKRLGALIGYDTVCVPLVYTQVSIAILRRIVSNTYPPLISMFARQTTFVEMKLLGVSMINQLFCICWSITPNIFCLKLPFFLTVWNANSKRTTPLPYRHKFFSLKQSTYVLRV